MRPAVNPNTPRVLGFCAGALLLLAVNTFGGLSAESAPTAVGGDAPSAASLAEVPAPIDVSADGELLLLFLPGGQGFELVNTRTGQRDIVSATPNTGYFATLSPDKKYVCFKDFQAVGGERLQVPVLYDIAGKKTVLLDKPAPAVGNPVASARGQIAYTLGAQLVVLKPDYSRVMAADLGAVVNVLAFSPDGSRLAFSDPNETLSWIDLGTGTRSTLPAARVHGYQPRFSPDGQALLARSSNNEITAVHLSTGVARSFGRARAAGWVDADTVALVRKTVAHYAVSQTEVVKGKLSDGSISRWLTRQGNVEVAVNASVLALVAQDDISLADAHTGRLQKSVVHPRSAWAAPAAAAASAAPAVNPLKALTNTTTVQLTGVPYIHQLYDTADDFPGGACCNATATLMAIQYYGRLPAHPITCTSGGTHISNYGYYISNSYTNNGHIYNIPATSIWGSAYAGFCGGFGYFLQDTIDELALHSSRLTQWASYHNLVSRHGRPRDGYQRREQRLSQSAGRDRCQSPGRRPERADYCRALHHLHRLREEPIHADLQ